MICAANLCRSGRKECTRAECGYVLDEHDRGTLAHDRAMHARVGSFYPPASTEAQDRAKADEDSAMVVKGAWLGIAIVAVVVAASARWLYLNWWALRALMGV